MRYTRPLSVSSETRLRPSFFRTTPARKPRTECCCHSVTVMMAAIVAPAGVRSIARMRACLVSGRVEVFGGECADCERGLDLLVVLLAERAEALDLDFVMGSSEVMRRHPPHHLSPAGAKPRQGKTAKRAFASSKSSQPRSDRTRKPVKSEQDSCSFDSNHGLRTAGSNCGPPGPIAYFSVDAAGQSVYLPNRVELRF